MTAPLPIIRIGCTKFQDRGLCFYKRFRFANNDESSHPEDAITQIVHYVLTSPPPSVFYDDHKGRKVCLSDNGDKEVAFLRDSDYLELEIDTSVAQMRIYAAGVGVTTKPYQPPSRPIAPPTATALSATTTSSTMQSKPLVGKELDSPQAQPIMVPKIAAAAAATVDPPKPTSDPHPQAQMGTVKLSLVQSLSPIYVCGEAVRIELRVVNAGQITIPRMSQLRQISQLNIPAMISTLTKDLAPGEMAIITISLQTIEVNQLTDYFFTFKLTSNLVTITGGEITLKITVDHRTTRKQSQASSGTSVAPTPAAMTESVQMDQLQVLALASQQPIEVVEMVFKKFNYNMDAALEHLMTL